MSSKRLSNAGLTQVSSRVELPNYDRGSVSAGILHLGTGAFHRAHQAVYVDDLLAAGAKNWGIIGASLRSLSVSEQLNPQDGLYSVIVRDGDESRVRVIGSVSRVIHMPTQLQALLDTLADSTIKIVTLTVTEKGYCLDPASGNLQLDHPAVARDLLNPVAPETAIGVLVQGLLRRRQAGAGPVTLLSCDNLPDNGKTLARVLLQFAELLDADLAGWIKQNTSFPCSMIDRIVPATTEQDKAKAAELLGLQDEGLVVTEPFSQWVIEDNFCAGRPEFESVGVQMVQDVRVYEYIKLRFLNGAHSLLAYAGYLSGFETVADAMAEPKFKRLIQAFWQKEVRPSVEVPADFNIDAYQQQLIERFSNSALRHKTWQIAMDGSQKIPQRWLATLRYQLANNGSVRGLCFSLACWIIYVGAKDEQGRAIDVKDPLAQVFANIHRECAGNAEQLVGAFLRNESVFGTDLAGSEGLVLELSYWLSQILKLGVLAAASNFLAA